ncbi:MAG TPA: DUF5995 family protein [Acidimicrobiia bacterium]|nr:DUF5995 family protein [Acidimicrobiia bacterium]
MAGLRDCPVLRGGPVAGVPDVIDRLTAIRDGVRKVAPDCGVGYFSDLYLTITEGIQGHIESGGFFTDDEYLARLDVVFANRYFDALRMWAGGGRVPAAWGLLFEAPENGEITAIQLAGAGVNAHINFDLAVAAVETGREFGDADLDTGSRRHDYDRVNDVFAEQMHVLMGRLLDERAASSGEPSVFLVALCELMERIVETARRCAWADAGILWSYRRGSPEWATKERHMDAVATLVGRSVLWDLPG